MTPSVSPRNRDPYQPTKQSLVGRKHEVSELIGAQRMAEADIARAVAQMGDPPKNVDPESPLWIHWPFRLMSAMPSWIGSRVSELMANRPAAAMGWPRFGSSAA